MAGLLSIERQGAVAVLTLQRPGKRNALSIDLRIELSAALEQLGSDGDIRALVLTGAGAAFCSGMDVTQFGGDRQNRERLVETSTRMMSALARCPKPVVAAVNGPALAGGFVLALLCDLRIAAETATFGFPELPRGIPPSYAAARAVLPAALARELCLTGRILGAAEAEAHGLVSSVHPSADAVGRAIEVAAGIADAPPFAVMETKRRAILDAEGSWLALFAEEERVFREAVLGSGQTDPAP